MLVSADIQAYLNEKTKLIEQRLDKLLRFADSPADRLFAAARYALLGGGKRLRPILTLAAAETFGAPAEKALDTACALELIHTYSLIHDDLPCMDDDDFRRGKPTVHKAFDEATAVLAGDFLLTYAFEVVATDNALGAEQKAALIPLIAQGAGGSGMVGGQMMDIEAEGQTISLEHLQMIHSAKTGALISTALLSGACIANALPEETAALACFGKALGLAFQIVDDVIDVTASCAKHGKAVASDAANHKTTYVTLLGIEGSRVSAAQLYDQALTHLAKIQRDTTLLKALAERLVRRNG